MASGNGFRRPWRFCTADQVFKNQVAAVPQAVPQLPSILRNGRMLHGRLISTRFMPQTIMILRRSLLSHGRDRRLAHFGISRRWAAPWVGKLDVLLRIVDNGVGQRTNR
jgi:hypothetical protein